MLIIKYERIDFFGSRVYTEDRKRNYSRDDLRKALLFFGKNHDSTIEIENIVLYWDSLTEYENRIVSIRFYDNGNYTEEKRAFEKEKKEIYAMIQE
jgi:Ca2+-binding EF-hand superfamily protein